MTVHQTARPAECYLDVPIDELLARARVLRDLASGYDETALEHENAAEWHRARGEVETVAPRRVKHLKRGTSYEVIGTAELQINTGDLVDGSALTIYRDDDGKWWARRNDEFEDGRFEDVPND